MFKYPHSQFVCLRLLFFLSHYSNKFAALPEKEKPLKLGFKGSVVAGTGLFYDPENGGLTTKPSFTA